MSSLAVKFRPTEFADVSGQESVIKILNRQLELKEYSNVYAFSGPTGVGKTTLARIFASKINGGVGNPIEIDGASNNGVDNIRSIIKSAQERSIDSEYKIFILDECQMITTAGWNAFLKALEEPPKYTIFMFCTTEPKKIPATIQNRLMKFNLTRIPTDSIKARLDFICDAEGYINYKESTDYISRIADGGMRDAIAMLEKCSNYSHDLNIDNVLQALGNFSYDVMFTLTNALIDGNEKVIINTIEDLYNSGNDLKTFVDVYLDFVLDLNKFCIFKSLDNIKIPAFKENDIKYAVSIENNTVHFNKMVNRILDIKTLIKNDLSVKNTLIISLLKFSRGL